MARNGGDGCCRLVRRFRPQEQAQLGVLAVFDQQRLVGYLGALQQRACAGGAADLPGGTEHSGGDQSPVLRKSLVQQSFRHGWGTTVRLVAAAIVSAII